MNGLGYSNHNGSGKLSNGAAGAVYHVEDGGSFHGDEEDDVAFDSANNIESFFDEEADQAQGMDAEDADLDGYLNDLYGGGSGEAAEAAPGEHQVHESPTAPNQVSSGGVSRRNESSKGLYEIAVKKVNNENVYEYTCKLCSKLTIGSKEILRHLKKEHGKEFYVYQCKACDFATQYRASLNRHKRSVHGGSGGVGAKPAPASAAAAAPAILSKTLPAKMDTTKQEVVTLGSSPEPDQPAAVNANNSNSNVDRRNLRSSNSQLNKTEPASSSQQSNGGGHHHHLNRTNSGTSLQNGVVRNGGGQQQQQFHSRFGGGQNGFSSFRRPVVTVSHIYKKYQCSECSLKSKNLFDIRKHINQKHKGQAEVQMNRDYVGHSRKIVNKYSPFTRPGYHTFTSASTNNNHSNDTKPDNGSSRPANGQETSNNASNHSFNEMTSSNQNGYHHDDHNDHDEGEKEEVEEEDEEDDSANEAANPAVQDFRALLNQYELRLTGLDMNYRTLNMNVVNIDTRLTTLDSRIVRIEDKLETILKLLQAKP